MVLDKLVSKYLTELRSSVETTRCGYALALGALPRFMLSGHLCDVIEGLVEATVLVDKQIAFAESRRDAVKALTGFGHLYYKLIHL